MYDISVTDISLIEMATPVYGDIMPGYHEQPGTISITRPVQNLSTVGANAVPLIDSPSYTYFLDVPINNTPDTLMIQISPTIDYLIYIEGLSPGIRSFATYVTIAAGSTLPENNNLYLRDVTLAFSITTITGEDFLVINETTLPGTFRVMVEILQQ